MPLILPVSLVLLLAAGPAVPATAVRGTKDTKDTQKDTKDTQKDTKEKDKQKDTKKKDKKAKKKEDGEKKPKGDNAAKSKYPAFKLDDHPSIHFAKGTHLDFRGRFAADVHDSDAPDADTTESSAIDLGKKRLGVSGEIANVV